MPVVTLTKSNSIAIDTHVSQQDPANGSFSSNSMLYIGANASGQIFRSLLKFDLGLIPNDAIINSATLTLSVSSSVASAAQNVSVHKVTSNWDGTASWNTQPGFDSVVQSSVLTGNAGGQVANFNIKQLVQEWVNGAPNYGVLLKVVNESLLNSRFAFNSLDSGSPPTLTIDYTIPSTGKKQVEYVGTTTIAGSSSATSLTIPSVPTGAQAGDLLVALVGHTASGQTISAPTGWTRRAGITSGGRFDIFTKTMQAGDSSFQFTTSAGTNWFGCIAAFRNVKGVLNTAFNNALSTTQFYPPATTTTVQKTVFLLVNALFSDSRTFTPPKSYNEIIDAVAVNSAGVIESSFRYMHSDLDQTTSEMTSVCSATPINQGLSAVMVLEPIVNNPPTLTLTSPVDNQTLAEGNSYPVEGTASDADSGNVVTVKYQINNGPVRALQSGVSDGSTPISFARNLVYRNKRIWDGSIDVAGVDLAENTDHTFKVWSEDDQGGKSAEITRKFRVSHNKPPAITVDAFTPVQSGLIPPDLITISGTVSDPDGNTVTVTGKANNGAPQTLLSGVSGGNWSFSFPVSALQEGGNTITITATDQFGSSTVKTFNVNNAITKTPLDKGVARYKVTPPLGAAKEILAWMQREIGDLSVDGAASFVDAGQSEQYMTMAKSSVDLAHGIAEDEFVASVADPKADIVFKQTFTRTNTDSSESALKLVGVIE